MPYRDIQEAASLVRAGEGSLVCSLFSRDHGTVGDFVGEVASSLARAWLIAEGVTQKCSAVCRTLSPRSIVSRILRWLRSSADKMLSDEPSTKCADTGLCRQ
tara:strand:- start:6330 stop:6635 length:306 start_codon:yes stop_codon:yes gene_type:complete